MSFIDFDAYLEDKVHTLCKTQVVLYSDVITLCKMYEDKLAKLPDSEEEVEVFNILDEFISQLDNNFLYKVDEKTDCYVISICPTEAFDRWYNSRHINLTLYKCWDKEALQQSFLVESVKYLLKEIPTTMWCRGMEVNL